MILLTIFGPNERRVGKKSSTKEMWREDGVDAAEWTGRNLQVTPRAELGALEAPA